MEFLHIAGFPGEGPSREGEKPKRKHKGAEAGKLMICTMNGSAYSTAKTFLGEHHTSKTIVAVQEHRLRGEALTVATNASKVGGWQLAAGDAKDTFGPALGQERTEQHTSGGVLLAVPTTIGMQLMYGAGSWEIAADKHPGRAVVSWVAALQGILVASAYLYTSEGWSDRNTELMHEIMSTLVDSGLPWVLAADFNMEPSTMQEFLGRAEADAMVVAPTTALGTCRQAGTHRTYDYFIVSSHLRPLVTSVEVVEDFPSTPHKPVRMSLDIRTHRMYQRVQVKPGPLPLEAGIGCRPPPLVWPEVPDTFTTVEQASQCWAEVISVAEEEILRATGVQEEDWKKHQGRGAKPAFRVQKVIWAAHPDLPGGYDKARQRKRVLARLKEAEALLAKGAMQALTEKQFEAFGRLRHLCHLECIDTPAEEEVLAGILEWLANPAAGTRRSEAASSTASTPWKWRCTGTSRRS